MKQIEALNIPKEVFSNLIISVAAAVVLICAAAGGYIINQRLDQSISNVRKKLEEHKVLAPFYDGLVKAPQGMPAGLTVPARAKLGKTGSDGAVAKIRDLVEKNGMTVISVSPEVGSPGGGAAGSLAITISLSGNFVKFRSVLSDLGSLPYLDNITNVSIQSTTDPNVLNFTAKILVAAA